MLAESVMLIARNKDEVSFTDIYKWTIKSSFQ